MKFLIKVKKPGYRYKAGIRTQPPNCYVEYDMGISISKKGQQMSKSTKSTKYAHPEGQLPATQYGCTSGTTMVSDVITATVIIQNTQK